MKAILSKLFKSKEKKQESRPQEKEPEFKRNYSGVYGEVTPNVAQREIKDYYNNLGNQQKPHPVSTSESVPAVNKLTTTFRKLNP